MAGDYSRITFDPRRRFAAVLMQQGRVQLDADWNEQAAILAERIRIQARETFGRAAASRFGTLDAFRIGAIAGPPRDLSIQPGRYWVEGRLAEAFAADGSPPTYLRQPFLPAPPPLPAQGGAIVYLEAWEREVTWVEEPALLDVALGGVDTAARVQAVWQVKWRAMQGAACGADLDALFPPSPARLTTAAVAPPVPEDPCLIAPLTGYRGLENRLYRVEVHLGGDAAAARFKFSRDNASIRSPVLGMRRELRGAVEVTVLSVARIGRDPGLRIAAGDWVEITDEHRFLHDESGEMAQVAEPPLEQPGEDGVQVVLDRVIPAAGTRGFGADAAQLAARRTRIIRWDQAAPRNTLDGNGLMAVGSAAVPLEEGVEVTFSLAGTGAQYRRGDWWVFAARTADASVEVLSAAPPRGPRRAYAQLAAFAEIGRGESPSDCRTIWPPQVQGGGEGCCTMVVRPGEDVQAAIEALGPQGGCVCLKPGVHELRDTLRIRGGRVSLHAEAPGAAVLRRAGQVPLLAIGAGAESRMPVVDVHVAGIVFQLGSLDDQRGGFDGLVAVAEDARRVTLSHCRFAVQDVAGRCAGLRIAGAEVAVQGCTFERLPVGIAIVDAARDVAVADGAFLADGTLQPGVDDGFVAIGVEACAGTLRVERNAIIGYRRGILLGAIGEKGIATELAMIAGNLVLRGEPRDAAPEPAETVPGGLRDQPLRLNRLSMLDAAPSLVRGIATGAETPLFAIASAARNATVAENVLAWRSPRYGGILAGAGARLVAGNDLLYRGDGGQASLTLGIALGLEGSRPAAGCVVEGNVVLGPLLGIAVGQVEAPAIRGNILARGLAGLLVNGAVNPRIAGNTVTGAGTGMLVAECAAPRIEDNLVLATRATGITLICSGRDRAGGLHRITGNTLLNCATEEETATAIAATCAEVVPEGEATTVANTEIVLEHNLVSETGVDPAGKARVARVHAVVLAAPRVTVHGNDIGWEAPARSDLGLKLLAEEGGKPSRALVVQPVATAAFVPGIEGSAAVTASITDNRIRGYAADALVEIRDGDKGPDGQPPARFLALTFSGNAVEHWGPLDTPGPAAASVVLRADPRAVVAGAGNVVRGPGRRPSVLVEGPKQAAMAGNATTGPIIGVTVAMNVVV
jgi:hypothetical protein